MSIHEAARGLSARLYPPHRLRCRKGQALVEAALITPILLLLLLGLVESGNALSVRHKLAVLTREGANLASRGSTLEETLDVVMSNGEEVHLAEKGGVIVTRVIVIRGLPVIESQLATAGYEGNSRLGMADSIAVALQKLDLDEDQVFHAVEIVFRYQPMTPVGGMLPKGFAETVYDRAIF